MERHRRVGLDTTPNDRSSDPEPDPEPGLAPELAPAPDVPVRRPLGRWWRLAMILVAIGLFVSFGPVNAAEQVQHAIVHTFGDGPDGGCGGG